MPACVPGAVTRTCLVGTLCALLAVLGFSGYYLASYLDFLGLTYITAGLERLILFLHPTIVVLLTFAMAIIATVIPAWLMAEGIRLTGANHAAMVGSIGPVATIFFGYWFLSEPVTVIQITGAALVLAGVTLVGTRRT
jgi:drug/metabolite transporter (DMT)-like permease